MGKAKTKATNRMDRAGRLLSSFLHLGETFRRPGASEVTVEHGTQHSGKACSPSSESTKASGEHALSEQQLPTASSASHQPLEEAGTATSSGGSPSTTEAPGVEASAQPGDSMSGMDEMPSQKPAVQAKGADSRAIRRLREHLITYARCAAEHARHTLLGAMLTRGMCCVCHPGRWASGLRC